ncbi:MAG: trypsin-like peptidase domain-containing protein, partial [bacterium]|nr:trypsin-like peptidase domain-containing protein [bacterium]
HGEPVYVIGHPVGLPLKYSPGAKVSDTRAAYFSADLDIYSCNSGSPVFNSTDHTVVGIVVRGDSQDFRWTGKDWISILYPNPQFLSRKPQCTRSREFSRFCPG